MLNQMCASLVFFLLFFYFKGIPGNRGSPGLPGPTGVEVKQISLNLPLNPASRLENLTLLSFVSCCVRVHVGQMGTKASKGGRVFR